MDIASHGLWGGAAFGRKNKKSFWAAFCFGIFPDFFAFSFGFVQFFISRTLVHGDSVLISPEDGYKNIPDYVFTLYSISHSLFTFLVVFLIVYLVVKRPLYEMFAWPLHIAMDIFTHGQSFFPTPFLWPLFNYSFNGISWANPIIFIPNVMLLSIVYFLIFKNKNSYKNLA